MKIILNNEKKYEFIFNQEEEEFFNSLDNKTRYKVRGFLMYRMILDNKVSKMKLSPMQHCLAKFIILELYNNPETNSTNLRLNSTKKMIEHFQLIAEKYKGNIEEINNSKYKYILLKGKKKTKHEGKIRLRFYKFNPVVIYKLRPSIINYKMSLIRRYMKWNVILSLTKIGSTIAWFLSREVIE